jgi:hypothetical protein
MATGAPHDCPETDPWPTLSGTFIPPWRPIDAFAAAACTLSVHFQPEVMAPTIVVLTSRLKPQILPTIVGWREAILLTK